jgi:hypothetical protein
MASFRLESVLVSEISELDEVSFRSIVLKKKKYLLI